MAAPTTAVHLPDKLRLITRSWSPRVVAEANRWEVKLVRACGEFVWHEHPDVDEVFLVLAGDLVISLDGRPDVALSAGDLFVVPRGVQHRPAAEGDCHLLLLEPAGVVNTGASGGPLTAVEKWL